MSRIAHRLLSWSFLASSVLLAAACSGGVDPVGGGLDVEPKAPTIAAGGTIGFRAYSGSAAPLATVGWTSSGCSIDATGLFTASCSVGTYTVSATVGGVTGSTTVRVAAVGSPAAFYAAASAECAAMPIRSTGTTRYFCDCQPGAQAGCVAGNDANAGTSPSAPKRTVAAAASAFNAMAAGDTIAFCKGGAFAATGAGLANTRCSPGADIGAAANTTTCDIRDYAAPWGGNARPILSFASGNGLSFATETAPTNGVRILNLDLEGNGTAGVAIFSYGPHSYLYTCNAVLNGWGLAYQDQPASGYPDPANHSIVGSVITNSRSQGMLARGHNLRIDSNFFDNNGSTNNRDHTLYISAINNPPALNGSVVNNEIRYSRGGCAGNPFIVHGNWDGFNIENNIIDAGPSPTSGCWNLSVENDSGFANSGFRNVTIRRNFFTGNGNHQVLASASPGVIIENNVLDVHSMYTSGGAIQVVWQTAYTGDLVTNNATVRNNTIYFSGAGSSSGSVGIFVGNEGTGHVVANNSIYFAGGAGTCFSTNLAGSAYTFVGNNACFNGTWGTGYDATAHVTSDPLFVNGLSDLTPQATSPLLGAGNAAYAPITDMNLKTRPNPPSIGALER